MTMTLFLWTIREPSRPLDSLLIFSRSAESSANSRPPRQASRSSIGTRRFISTSVCAYRHIPCQPHFRVLIRCATPSGGRNPSRSASQAEARRARPLDDQVGVEGRNLPLDGEPRVEHELRKPTLDTLLRISTAMKISLAPIIEAAECRPSSGKKVRPASDGLDLAAIGEWFQAWQAFRSS